MAKWRKLIIKDEEWQWCLGYGKVKGYQIHFVSPTGIKNSYPETDVIGETLKIPGDTWCHAEITPYDIAKYIRKHKKVLTKENRKFRSKKIKK